MSSFYKSSRARHLSITTKYSIVKYEQGLPFLQHHQRPGLPVQYEQSSPLQFAKNIFSLISYMHKGGVVLS